MNAGVDQDVAQLLRQLEDHWIRVGAPFRPYLAPGLGPVDVDAQTARLGLALPREGKQWFAWHNGTPGAPAGLPTTIGPPFSLLSLQQCIDLYTDERSFAAELVAEGFTESADEIWPASWFPLARLDDSRNILVLETGRGTGVEARVGCVQKEARLSPQDGLTVVELLRFWLQCLNENRYHWDGTGIWHRPPPAEYSPGYRLAWFC